MERKTGWWVEGREAGAGEWPGRWAGEQVCVRVKVSCGIANNFSGGLEISHFL